MDNIIDEKRDIELLKKEEKKDYLESHNIDDFTDTIQIPRFSLEDTIQISRDDLNE